MSEMSHVDFQKACDTLSSTVDAEQFERFRWSRDEAPRLAHLVELVKGSVGDRTDVEINEEGGAHANKRFVIKVHGQRVAGLGVALDKGRAVVSIGPVERSRFLVAQGKPLHTEIDNADAAWMAETLGVLMARVTPGHVADTGPDVAEPVPEGEDASDPVEETPSQPNPDIDKRSQAL